MRVCVCCVSCVYVLWGCGVVVVCFVCCCLFFYVLLLLLFYFLGGGGGGGVCSFLGGFSLHVYMCMITCLILHHEI